MNDTSSGTRESTSPLLRPFWNSGERRLRMLWRLIGFALIFYVLSFILGFALVALGWATSILVQMALVPLASVAAMWLAARFLDRRPFPDYGLRLNRNWWTDLAFGLVLGALTMAVIFAIAWAAGWIVVTDTLATATPARPFLPALLIPILIFIAVGIYEELLIRGYLLRNLAEGLNLRWIPARGALALAWILSSIVFGFLHANNPNATVISTINLSLAGIFLGLAYVLTGSLATPIGLHITWNLFQGTVFGFPVSGVVFSDAQFLVIRDTGPELWTGGAFGPEAGLLGIVAMVLGSLLTLWWVSRRYGRPYLYGPLAVYRRGGTTDSATERPADPGLME
jgi:hypothetical protein